MVAFEFSALGSLFDLACASERDSLSSKGLSFKEGNRTLPRLEPNDPKGTGGSRILGSETNVSHGHQKPPRFSHRLCFFCVRL